MNQLGGYLRIGELARRTGTSPELLRAWEQRYDLLRPSRSTGGFRLYSQDDVERVLRTKELIAEGLSASDAASRARSAPAAAEPDAGPVEDALAEGLREALDRYDEDGANRALDRLFAAFSLEAVLQRILLPYLHALGDRWSSGQVSVAQEHFASALIRGRLLGLARGWGNGSGPSVVLACPPGEEHDLGLIIFGIALARRGWRVTYLGQDTPFDTIRQAASAVDATLVVLAVAVGTPTGEHAEELAALARDVPVAVGGGVVDGALEERGVRVLEGDPIDAAASL